MLILDNQGAKKGVVMKLNIIEMLNMFEDETCIWSVLFQMDPTKSKVLQSTRPVNGFDFLKEENVFCFNCYDGEIFNDKQHELKQVRDLKKEIIGFNGTTFCVNIFEFTNEGLKVSTHSIQSIIKNESHFTYLHLESFLDKESLMNIRDKRMESLDIECRYVK